MWTNWRKSSSSADLLRIVGLDNQDGRRSPIHMILYRPYYIRSSGLCSRPHGWSTACRINLRLWSTYLDIRKYSFGSELRRLPPLPLALPTSCCINFCFRSQIWLNCQNLEEIMSRRYQWDPTWRLCWRESFEPWMIGSAAFLVCNTCWNLFLA